MITKQLMQNYRRNLNEIESINYQLERLYREQEKIREQVVFDSVQSSNKDYPYQMQHTKVEGLQNDSDKSYGYMIKRQIAKLNKLQKQLTVATVEVVEYINNLEDGDVKSIITYRVLCGNSWKVVAKKMGAGYTDESVRQIYSRHFKHLR